MAEPVPVANESGYEILQDGERVLFLDRRTHAPLVTTADRF